MPKLSISISNEAFMLLRTLHDDEIMKGYTVSKIISDSIVHYANSRGYMVEPAKVVCVKSAYQVIET